MAGRLKDKVCIITGTGSGMGRAAALLFCAEGAKVVGCDINAESAEATLREALKAGGQMVSLQPADLTQQTQCDALAALALKSYGGIDVFTTTRRPPISAGWINSLSKNLLARSTRNC